jgi:curli biogenesis system outer membrane secretion channel CsgG
MMTNQRSLLALAIGAALAGCATQSPPSRQVEAPQSLEAQRAAQAQLAAQAPAKPMLKRKIALGRVTNESVYGHSLLRDRNDDPLGKQVTDMLSKALTESGAFIVLERPDIGRIKDEAALTGAKLELVGVDALVVGSVTEFGRKVVGETGFLSDSKKQIAFAKMDVRLVDSTTGQVFKAVSGSGEASTQTASVAGFGSQASYDGTLGDTALRNAVSEIVNKMSNELLSRPWQTSILQRQGDRIFISGGKSQGLKPGMTLAVETRGERVKSPQTGFTVTLPGQEVAKIKVESSFGDNETNEGSVATLVSGKLDGYKIETLTVVSKE